MKSDETGFYKAANEGIQEVMEGRHTLYSFISPFSNILQQDLKF